MRTLALLLLSLIFSSTAFAQSQLGIAAVVNDDIITTRDVDGRILLAIQGSGIQPTPDVLKEMSRQATEALIDEHIRLQEASRLGVTPKNEEVDEAFAKLAAQNNLEAEQFKKMLQQKPGMYDSLRQQLKTQLAWKNVVRKKVRPQVNVTENDINAYIKEKEKNPAKVEFQVAEIFLKNTDANQKLATQIVSELRSGKKRFSVLAKQFSQGLEASKGGLLGWIPERSLEPVLDNAIKATKPGEISDAVVSQRGIHILLVREKRDILSTKTASQRLKLKQVVVPLPPKVPPEIEAKALQQSKLWQAEAKDCTAMDALIKKINSPVSRDIGAVRLADLPPAAVNAVKDLPDNKAADPIRANDGYVVFMVCGREENSEEAMRDDVANMIGTERLNRLQSRYYRDLRSAAYVDFK
jgi:peptidyl-prolyl cis-trans isomerase SurA